MRRQQTSAGKRRGELRDAGLIEDFGFALAGTEWQPGNRLENNRTRATGCRHVRCRSGRHRLGPDGMTEYKWMSRDAWSVHVRTPYGDLFEGYRVS